MLRNLTLFTLTFALFALPAMAADSNCLSCHRDFEEQDGPSHKFIRDIHRSKGLDCVDCHGGDHTLEDMDDVREVKGYRGVPSHAEVPQFCGRCHSDVAYMGQRNPSLPTDQLDKYKTSVHGKLLFGKGDKNTANCISCHSVHDIADSRTPHSTVYATNIPKTCGRCHADEAYMAKYNIPTDQLADYQQSVHGMALLERGDLGAPACNDCHGNHGATPPGFSSISTVCGNCHALQWELFDNSPHKIAYEENDFPMCETCHSNHKILRPSDDMLGITEGSVCLECHAQDDGNRGYETAAGVAESVNKLLVAHLGARALLNDAITKGMMTTDEEFRLKEVESALLETRSMVHAFNIDSVLSRSEAGVAKADSVTANAASLIDEYYFRRRGLVVATVIIAILAIALYVKIRRMAG